MWATYSCSFLSTLGLYVAAYDLSHDFKISLGSICFGSNSIVKILNLYQPKTKIVIDTDKNKETLMSLGCPHLISYGFVAHFAHMIENTQENTAKMKTGEIPQVLQQKFQFHTGF